ncbi:MAG: ferrochelatase [Thermaerobacterales bacterium]
MNNIKTGLLVMAYGTPQSLDQVEAYYTHIRGGRVPTPEAVEELKDRYRLVGGRSPLTEITERQAHGLAGRVADRLATSVTPYVGMKHAPPFIAEAVEQMVADGLDRAVAIVMTPQYSTMSVGGYQRAVHSALAAHEADMDIRFVDHWHRHPGFIECLADRVRKAMSTLPEPVRPHTAVVFTAHSLPVRVIETGDPYAEHLRELAGAAAAAAELSWWDIAYQSAGKTAVPWLGPDICDVIPTLAQAGAKGVVVCPAGFVADHLEVFYDIDVEARAAARQAGMDLARTESLNDSADFLDALAHVVIRKFDGQER